MHPVLAARAVALLPALTLAASAGQADGIVFVYGSTTAREVPVFLVTVGPDGSERTPIAEAAYFADSAWSPDRSRIAFVEASDCVWRAAAHGTGARPLTRGRSADSGPAWSPDARWLAFTRARQGSEVWLARASGGAPKQLTRSTGAGAAADWAQGWSPDGRRLLYVRYGSPGASYFTYVAGELDESTRTVDVVPAGGPVEYLFEGCDPDW